MLRWSYVAQVPWNAEELFQQFQNVACLRENFFVLFCAAVRILADKIFPLKLFLYFNFQQIDNNETKIAENSRKHFFVCLMEEFLVQQSYFKADVSIRNLTQFLQMKISQIGTLVISNGISFGLNVYLCTCVPVQKLCQIFLHSNSLSPK